MSSSCTPAARRRFSPTRARSASELVLRPLKRLLTDRRPIPALRQIAFKYLQKSTIFGVRGVAPARRFWHGPGRFEAAFLGRAASLCAGRVRGAGVGQSKTI